MWVLDKLINDIPYSRDEHGLKMALKYIINEMRVHEGIKIEARRRLTLLTIKGK